MYIKNIVNKNISTVERANWNGLNNSILISLPYQNRVLDKQWIYDKLCNAS